MRGAGRKVKEGEAKAASDLEDATVGEGEGGGGGWIGYIGGGEETGLGWAGHQFGDLHSSAIYPTSSPPLPSYPQPPTLGPPLLTLNSGRRRRRRCLLLAAVA